MTVSHVELTSVTGVVRLGGMPEALSPPGTLTRMRRFVLGSVLMMAVAVAAYALWTFADVHGRGPLTITLGVLAVLVVAVTVQMYAVPFGATGGPRWNGAVPAVGLGAVLVATVLEASATHVGPGAMLLIGLLASGMVLCAPEERRGRVVLWAVVISAVLAAVIAAARGPTPFLGAPLCSLIASLAVWSSWWTYGVAFRLDQARTAEGELAVARERLRFAAELHDIQGHHLQVIALKSELASRLGDRDPRAASAQMREVERLARDALDDTRAVVGGYREVRLRTEIANAVRVLTAAGVHARYATDPEQIEIADRAAERLLGLAVREATTNMIRHARPAWARIDLAVRDGAQRLTVHNDGVRDTDGGSGSGLRTLAKRFAAAGGTLRWVHEGNEFTVTAELS